jgi:hypothetical protein
VVLRGLSSQVAYRVVAGRASEAGVSNVTPHDLRRTLIGRMLDNGADLPVVQRCVPRHFRVSRCVSDRNYTRRVPRRVGFVSKSGYSGALDALNAGLEEPRRTACGSVPPPPSSTKARHLYLVR